MNHVLGVSKRNMKFKLRSVIAVRRNREILANSTPALLAVGR
ncbi:MAG: hypothetical protein ACO3DX_00210 [Candidatus Nanopelagicales bacterium]